jgi:hypothetical protein
MKRARYILCGFAAAAIIVSLIFFAAYAGENVGYTRESVHTSAENLARGKRVEAAARSPGLFTDGDYSTYITMRAKTGSVVVDLGEPAVFNTVILREKGFNVKEFSVFYLDAEGEYRFLLRQDKIEDYRYLAFSPVTSSKLKIEITDSIAIPRLIECEAFNVPKKPGGFTAAGYLISGRIPKNVIKGEPFDYGIFSGYDRFTVISGVKMNPEDGTAVERISENGESELKITTDAIHAQSVLLNKRHEVFITVSGVETALLKSKARGASIVNIAELAEKYGADGIDFNWEFPVGEEDFRLFSAYITDVKAEFAARNIKLSLALYGWGQSLFGEEARVAIDYVNLMGYDQYDQDGNGGSFLSGVLQPVNYFLDLGFPREKIVLGMPFYGTPVNAVTRQIGFGNPVFRRENYFDNRLINGATGEVCAFNSPQLIYDKTAYAIHSGLSGVFCWEIGADVDSGNEYSLLKAIVRAKEERMI